MTTAAQWYSAGMTFRLADVVPWGRSFDEYVAMFALSDRDLERRILGCSDGPASFNAELSRNGGRVVSSDPIYRFSPDELRARVEQTASVVATQLRENADEFVWTHFTSADDVVETRMSAMDAFLRDFSSGPSDGRYIDASLPSLPFADDAFELALCSHFLFLYSAQHDLDFHQRSTAELCRVAAEVRIFPLLELGSVTSRHLESVLGTLDAQGARTEIVPVPYEFQRGGNQMLVIRR